MRAVEKRRRAQDELPHLRVPRGDERLHRPHALELVRPSGRVTGRREKREMHERVDALRGEDLRQARLRARLREIDFVPTRLRTGRVDLVDVDRDDATDALVFLEKADEIGPQEGGGAGQRHHALFPPRTADVTAIFVLHRHFWPRDSESDGGSLARPTFGLRSSLVHP